MRREIPPKKNSCLTGIDVLNSYMWWDFQLYQDVAFRQELNFLMFKWGKIWILLYKLYHENFYKITADLDLEMVLLQKNTALTSQLTIQLYCLEDCWYTVR